MIEMLANYRSRHWEEALALIERGRASDEANTLKLLFDIYEERIREFQQNPPPDDWDGAFALTSK
jgi:adenylate cyclase